MRGSRICWAVMAFALVAVSTPAAAFNCYAIVDRNNEVIYQGALSPVDLSEEGAATRDALRARGQQLIAMDIDNCPAIDRVNLTTRGGPATVEEIVSGMRSATPYGIGGSTARQPDVSRDGIRLPQITVPRATGGGVSTSGPPSGMSIR